MNLAWLSSIPGALLGALAMYYMARVQRTDRQQELAAQRQQDEARARRDAWRTEHDSLRELLIAAADLAYQVQTRGPLTSADLDSLKASKLHMDLEQASQRLLDELQEPIRTTAKRVAELLPHAIASDDDTLSAYESVRSGETTAVASTRTIRSEHIRAVAQDRAATDLAEAVGAARRALTKAWGG
ncbi:hypothetical protein [Streptomyces griseorubiginosus]|uniref:Uncharacterized protein n=1 Tax=Streptomyces griseorubiginosus TaxID=67304 RepID=A0A101RMP3_9ACTN|nr:hypothetical protein [Streptomyces griseorubiginosus]KUN58449.1 hypothetical protein AQJ54_42045 [Streptomyces griseorubiginosus]